MKCQLNLYVDQEVNDEFRRLAMEAGFGKKPAPFLEVLLAMYRPILSRLYSRLERAFRERQEPLTKEERFYAEQIRDLFDSVLKKP